MQVLHHQECALFRTCEPTCQQNKLDLTTGTMETFQIESCVRRPSQDIWNPSSGEELTCSYEIENIQDLFAVAVKRIEQLLLAMA